ncbi:AfsR/SARP family transcriptional regulator [Deinococcus pimensis]|uniref:AfsR/SARP family transcriptional regulator n=1 Tax=Deinococcus pimensis TaxID=309888 RepID=UPI0004AD719C|nr:BTAD domain-containing putative transcriptional regulator [Deinococcus pimensis]
MPSTLSITTLGHTAGHITRFGREVLPGHGQVRDLFFYLLAAPDGRTRAQIVEDLWGTDEDDAALNRLRVTLHRLKAAFDGLCVVQEHGGRYRLNPDLAAKSDLHTFDVCLSLARQHLGPDERRARLEEAAHRYPGDFLTDVRATWAQEARDALRARYVRVLLELSSVHCDAAHCRGATCRLSQALTLDPFQGERLHQNLIACLAEQGDASAAIGHFRGFARFLRDDLGDAPLEETRALADLVREGRPPCPRHVSGEGPCPKRAREAAERHHASPPQPAQTLLLDLSEALLGAAGLDDAAGAVTRVLEASLGVTAVVVADVRLEDDELTFVHASGDLPDLTRARVAARTSVPASSSALYEACLRTVTPLYLRDARSLAPDLPAVASAVEPIRVGEDRVLFVQVMRPPALGDWTMDERRLLARACRLFALAAARNVPA